MQTVWMVHLFKMNYLVFKIKKKKLIMKSYCLRNKHTRVSKRGSNMKTHYKLRSKVMIIDYKVGL